MSASGEDVPKFDNVASLFEAVTSLVRKSPKDTELSTDIRLRLYGYFKQATSGPPTGTRPSVMNVRALAKYKAWNECASMEKEVAMKSYVDLIAEQTHLEIGQTVKEYASAYSGAIPQPQNALLSENSKVHDLFKPRWGVRPVVPRGQLDISYSDLAFATAHGICGCAGWSGSRKKYEKSIMDKWEKASTSHSCIVGLSARSLLDIYLRAKKYPFGSTVIMCPPLTVPGMMAVFNHHCIDVLPIDFPSEKVVSVDCDAIETALTKNTVAVMVVHVFGMKVASEDDMLRLKRICSNRNIDVLEDCAQAYRGLTGGVGSPHADLSLFSFGLMKTATSLGGGIGMVSDRTLRKNMMNIQLMHCEVQSSGRFLLKSLKATAVKIVATYPFVCGLVAHICASIGLDFDRTVSSLVRGFLSLSIHCFRALPSTSLLALLDRRFTDTSNVSAAIREKETRHRLFSKYLEPAASLRLPKFLPLENHAYWLYPVLSSSPNELCHKLRNAGFDATQGTTQLRCVGSEDMCPFSCRLMSSVVYLPFEAYMNHYLEYMTGAITTNNRRVTQSSPAFANYSVSILQFLVCLSVFYEYTNILFALVAICALLFATVAWSFFVLRCVAASHYLGASDVFARFSDTTCEHDKRIPSLECNQTFSSADADCESTVVVTGATGYVGSKLLHELLIHRRTLGIRRVVVVCRPKHGLSSTQRVHRLLEHEMFSFLSNEEKATIVDVVDGDTRFTNLSLDDATLKRICKDVCVTHLFNCAASVSFTQDLDTAARANISSALHVQELAAKLTPRVRLVHVSTAFVHGGETGSEHSPLRENLFPLASFDAEKIYESMLRTQYYASKAMHELGFPNTYTFSKCVAEHLLYQNRRNSVDTIIIRPSIVGPAFVEPYPGWFGRSPSTIVAATCLSFVCPWNFWSFANESVPYIPVDSLTRFIVSKSFVGGTKPEPSDTGSEQSLSSDDGFQKVVKTSVTSTFDICNAAWDVKSSPRSQFTWVQYAGAIAQYAVLTDRMTQQSAYLALYLSTKTLPGLGMTLSQFTRIHTLFILRPLLFIQYLLSVMGKSSESFRSLTTQISLPCLFFPFTSQGFFFESAVKAPEELRGGEYLTRCMKAADEFVAHKLVNDRKSTGTATLQVCPNHGSWVGDILWCISKPRGGIVTRITGLLLRSIIRSSFTSVNVDSGSFCATNRLLAGEKSVRVVLAPTHRSYFDFLLLSMCLFEFPELKVPLPFILAADDFERIPMLGALLKHLGAIFVKRGRGRVDPFLGETLVKLGTETCIEAFLEGTRSRDRRFLVPKTGALRCLQALGKEVIVVPIAISYEQIPEQESLCREIVSGVSNGMSLSGLMGWILRVCRNDLNLGKVYIKACKPLHLSGEPSSISPFASRVRIRQSEAVVLTSFHISAVASVLDLEHGSVEKALRSLGCDVRMAATRSVDDVTPSLPQCIDRQWCIALQAAPAMAAVVAKSRPGWAVWMFHPGDLKKQDDQLLQRPGVAILAQALTVKLDSAFDAASCALVDLEKADFPNPSDDHVLQLASRSGVPNVLLRGAVSLLDSRTRSVSVTASSLATLARNDDVLQSGERLGLWGYKDVYFVAQEDSTCGGAFVAFHGRDHYDLDETPIRSLIPFIEKELGVQIDLNLGLPSCSSRSPCTNVTAETLLPEDVTLLSQVSKVSTDEFERLRHGYCHCQADICDIRSQSYGRCPDVVVWPTTEAQVQEVVQLAREKEWCVIPFGGGTNVSQATTCPTFEEEPRPIVSVDMKSMDKVIYVDEENLLANVEAGITGKALVNELARRGYTMGHMPDSYEFSTLGGWVATKSSGMKRSKYGNIEDIVIGICVVDSNGDVLQHGEGMWGRDCCGVSLIDMLLASEGCLGIVTTVTIRLWPTPKLIDYDSILLPALQDGLAFCREITKHPGHMPTSVRLLDNAHFRFGRSLQPDALTLWESSIRAASHAFLNAVGSYKPESVVCATLLYEGSLADVAQEKKMIRHLVRKHSGMHLGSSVGKRGYETTFLIAYLRDFALSFGVLGESFETFVPWSKVTEVIDATKSRIRKEHEDRCLPGRPFVGSRVTQLYHEGVCVYFYFSMSAVGVENASNVFALIEHAARQEILDNGGSLSHHHGVGKIRAQFLTKVDSPAWIATRRALKQAIDPDNIFGARNGPYS